mgnify:CR=1 FL=1
MKKKQTILVIEDNPQNMYLTRFLLEAHGYAVEEANNGRLGIEAASALRPDLILLDIQLPQMNGYEVARALKSDEALVDIPIVAVTSYAMAGDKQLGIEAGCVGYIEKPINPDTFVAEMEEHLR